MNDLYTPAYGRFLHLDLLRGIGILGILLVNIYSFGLPQAEYFQPGSWTDFSGANRWVWGLVALFAEWKFLTIFSLLFGAGIWLFAQRLDIRGENATPIHYRRCRWLLLFGLLHAYLLWYGDILFTFALCAMVVWPLRRKTPSVQLMLGLGALALCSLFYWWITSMLYAPEPDRMSDGMEFFSADAAAGEVSAMRGSWLAQMPVRVDNAFRAQADVLLFGWRIVGLMLLGMVLVRIGLLFPARRVPGYQILAYLLVGLLLTGTGIMGGLAQDFALDYMLVSYFQYHYWGSIFTALAYCGAVLVWSRSDVLPGLQDRLAAIGRTAFSCYILQTLICTGIFYGHGLGLFGAFDRVQLMGVVLAVWGIQLWLAPWWLARFRFGPLEWLWRGLTYRQWPQFRRSTAANC